MRMHEGEICPSHHQVCDSHAHATMRAVRASQHSGDHWTVYHHRRCGWFHTRLTGQSRIRLAFGIGRKQ